MCLYVVGMFLQVINLLAFVFVFAFWLLTSDIYFKLYITKFREHPGKIVFHFGKSWNLSSKNV